MSTSLCGPYDEVRFSSPETCFQLQDDVSQAPIAPMHSYRPRSQVVSTTIDEDESVLLHLEAQQYYSLNETGHRIWQLLARGRAPGAIAAVLAEEWALSEAGALRHVRSFLQELCEEGLVEEVRGDAAT